MQDAPRPEPREPENALERVLEALDRGDEPDWSRIGAAPGPIGDFGGLERALERYRSLLREVRSARGDPALHAGDRLGDFEVERLLGRGGMGEVYRARQLSLGGRAVALKVLHPARRSGLDRERFEREARVLSRLHDPHLAEVYGFGTCQGQGFLAMRLVEGRTLRECIEHGPRVDRRTAVRWIEELASALATVHAAGLVHRDVKPSNVVLESRAGAEAAILIDFGLARPVDGDPRTEPGAAPLTRAYAAPEQLAGRGVDARADVFGLGTVLAELLELGALPPDGAESSERDLCAIVERATRSDPEQRYADAACLREDLRAWRAGLRVAARDPRPVERIGYFVRHHRTRLRVWTARAVVVGSLLGLALGADHLASELGSLHAADRSGDLLALRAAALALPPGLTRWLVDDSRVCGLALRLARGAEEDPLTGVVLALERGEAQDALAKAADVLERDGLTSDAALLEVLTRALGDVRLRPVALEELMLAADRRPVARLSELAGTESLRRCLRALRADASLSDAERQCLYSLVASTGDVLDAAQLARAIPTLDPAGEDARLACEALERTLRRALALGLQETLLDGVDWDALGAHVLALRRSDLATTWGNVAAQSRLMCQLHLARRRAGRVTSPWIALPPEWAAEPPRWKGQGAFETALELAACADAAAFGCLDVLEVESRRQWQAALVGRLGAWVGDREGTRAAIRTLVELGWTEDVARAEVERGWLDGVAERDRAWSAAEVSEDGAVDLSHDWLDSEGRFLCRRDESAPELSHLELTHGEGPRLSGRCVGASVRAASYRREGADRPYLMLDRPGRSELHIEFDLSETRWTEAKLHLRGQISTRRFLPHQGTASVAVLVDGRRVGTRVFSDTSSGWRVLPLDGVGLGGGRRRITLQLERGSTTSYRIEFVALGE